MQFLLGSTFSTFFFVVLVVLSAWTAVAQGAGESNGYSCLYYRCSRRNAAISAERARIDIVDVGTSATVESNKPLLISDVDELQRKTVSRGALIRQWLLVSGFARYGKGLMTNMKAA